MKKIFFILFTLSIIVTANAQEIEILDSMRQEADPMYNRGGCTIWGNEHMVFILSDAGTIEWQIRNPPHIFISDKSGLTGQNKGYSNARVGLFAENDSLLAIAEKWKAVPSEHGTILRMAADATMKRPNGEKIKVTPQHVFITLKKRKGSYVRVVTNVFGDYYYEVKAKMK